MAWLAVNQDGYEGISMDKPTRSPGEYHYWESIQRYGYHNTIYVNSLIPLPKGSIKKLIGRELTWEEEPVKI